VRSTAPPQDVNRLISVKVDNISPDTRKEALFDVFMK
jgi:hypothetical protein